MALGDHYKLNEIPHLDHTSLHAARFIPTLSFYSGEWQVFLQIGADKFVHAQAWPAEAVYFGTKPEEPTDIGSTFLNLLGQRANMRSLSRQYRAVLDDMFNLSASFAKLDLIRRSNSVGASRMAATEVEYILIVCRSIFDHLQETVEGIWSKTKPTDPRFQKRNLPTSFRGMVMKGGAALSADEILEKHKLFGPLAECYARHAELFLRLRTYRDRLVHGGQTVEHIYTGDDHLHINKRFGPFTDLDIWRPEEILVNDLVPLLPAVGMVVQATLAACEDFATTILQAIQLEPPIAPGMGLFIRGYFNKELVSVVEDANARIAEGRFLIAPSVAELR
jgi:hypothetical protein